jgi:hypothetical protein
MSVSVLIVNHLPLQNAVLLVSLAARVHEV